MTIKQEYQHFRSIFNQADKKALIILLSIAFLQTISWYFTSRTFFNDWLSDYFANTHGIGEFVYWFIGDFIVFFLIPAGIIRYIFKEKLRAYGIDRGNSKLGFNYTAVSLIVMIVVLWFISAQPSFTLFYPHYSGAKYSWTLFFIYETGMLFYLFAWEFIWRGYMLFGLKEKFGVYSIFIQMIPFVILHNGKPFVETLGAIGGGIFLGFLAFRTGSMLYCFFIHAGIMFVLDFFSTLRYQTAEFGIGPKSVYKILVLIFQGI